MIFVLCMTIAGGFAKNTIFFVTMFEMLKRDFGEILANYLTSLTNLSESGRLIRRNVSITKSCTVISATIFILPSSAHSEV